MKRISIFLAFILLLTVTLPISLTASAEVASVIRDYNFTSDLHGKTTGYSDQPTSFNLVDYPSFVHTSGTAVFDTHAAAGGTAAGTYITGASYPIRSSGTPAYPRMNFDGSDNYPTISAEDNELNVHTYEIDVKFEREFALTEFSIRYGQEGWSEGSAVRDENLVSVGNNGQVRFAGGDRYQLSLGVDYKISVVVDVRGASRKAHLFINETYIYERTGVELANPIAGPDKLKKVIYPSVIVRPYNGSGTNYTWIGTKLTIDNLRVLRGTDYSLPDSSIAVKGEPVFRKSPHNETTHSYVRASLNNAPDDFLYSLVGSVTGVTVEEETGKISVSPLANIGNKFTIRAALASNPASYNTFSMEIGSSTYHDFESNANGWYLNANVNPQFEILEQEIGNQYIEPQGQRVNSAGIGGDAKAGKLTLEFETMITENSGNINIAKATGPHDSGVGVDEGKWYLTINPKNKNNTTKKANLAIGGAGLTEQHFATVDMDDWINLKIVIDFNDAYIDVYMNDSPAALKYKLQSNYYDFKLSQIITYAPIDDVRVYSGSVYENLEINKSSNFLLIPPAGKFANAKFSVENPKGTPVWSLGGSYGSSISIDSVTGLLTVSGAATAQNIIIKVEDGAVTSIIEYPLKKYFYDFENDTVGQKPTPTGFWNHATIALDDGNKYVTKPADDRNRFELTSDRTIEGRYIFEVDLRVPDGVTDRITGITVMGQGDWITAYTLGEDDTEFKKYKFVIDTEAKTYSMFIDGVLEPTRTNVPFNVLGKSNVSGQETQDNTDFRFKGFATNLDIDNLTIYHAGNTPPHASIPVIEELSIGNELAASYKYVSEAGLPEECTQIEWFSCTTIDGVYSSLGSAYTPVSADLGKYFKVVVTPTSAGEIVGAPVESLPVALGGYVIPAITANNGAISENENNFEEGSNTLAATVNYINSGAENVDVTVCAAYYLGNKLISLDLDHEIVIPGGSASLEIELNFNIPTGKYLEKAVKLFMWDGYTLKPIMDEPMIIK